MNQKNAHVLLLGKGEQKQANQRDDKQRTSQKREEQLESPSHIKYNKKTSTHKFTQSESTAPRTCVNEVRVGRQQEVRVEKGTRQRSHFKSEMAAPTLNYTKQQKKRYSRKKEIRTAIEALPFPPHNTGKFCAAICFKRVLIVPKKSHWVKGGKKEVLLFLVLLLMPVMLLAHRFLQRVSLSGNAMLVSPRPMGRKGNASTKKG